MRAYTTNFKLQKKKNDFFIFISNDTTHVARQSSVQLQQRSVTTYVDDEARRYVVVPHSDRSTAAVAAAGTLYVRQLPKVQVTTVTLSSS